MYCLHRQNNHYRLMGHKSVIRDGWWCVGHVTASNHPCLTPQVLHIHIEYHMALDELMPNRRVVPFLPIHNINQLRNQIN